MKLTEAIKKIGEDKCAVQFLHECLKNISINKKGLSSVTFLTTNITPNEVMSGDPKLTGFIVWLPTEELKKL